VAAGDAPPPQARPAPAPAEAPLPSVLELLADAETFVGRTTERTALRDAWQLARSGHTVVVLVSGEPGIGKSRLVAELAVEVHDGGGDVLLGSCHEDVDAPFDPFVQAIVEDAARCADDELRRRAGGDADALARLAPELRPRLLASGPAVAAPET